MNIEDTPCFPRWKPFSKSHFHGLNIPLFSLRSKNSSGIGEFYDLVPILDWMHEIGLTALQLLPLNDSAHDPSPYNAISSCALHPIFLSLHKLPHLDDFPDLKKQLGTFKPFLESQRVPYHEVASAKRKFLEAYYPRAYERIAKTVEYKTFIDTNHYWLDEFSLFKSLKEHFGETSWKDWPEDIRNPSNHKIKEYGHRFENQKNYHAFVQFLCQKQLKDVHVYANNKGIVLKGDIPILISPDSADVWHNSYQFNMDYAAGACPDMYNAEGQYWGFPLFRWDVMREDDFSWWKRRLKFASELYDIYRIDHIIGFFRIWAIKHGDIPINGSFIPETDELVALQGKMILEMMLQTSRMLPIGEDLGVLPDIIYNSLRGLGIPGTKVLRWEKDRATNRNYTPFDKYLNASMSTVSTHDSETLQLWWEAYPEEARAYSTFCGWEYEPILSKERHVDILHQSHHTSSQFHINLLQEYFMPFPELCWEDPLDERINIPGFVLDRNWTYRFRPWVEEITTHQGLTDQMKSLIDTNKERKTG